MKKDSENKEKISFLDTLVNYAVIIRADVETIDQIKRDFAQNPGVEVVYQRYSFNKLFIKEDGEDDGKQH